jgi:hypothetical protein
MFPATNSNGLFRATHPFVLLIGFGVIFSGGCEQPPEARPAQLHALDAPAGTRLGALELWDDGLAEMAYYDARMEIYGEPREYTMVLLVNREWFNPATGTKDEGGRAANAVEVFKLNIAEEIPTANYNYRLLTTFFADRSDLAPRKQVASSQEWCGATYKHLRWRRASDDPALRVESFSYFEAEAETDLTLPIAAYPFESSFLLVRDFVARDEAEMTVPMLPPMRDNRGLVDPRVADAVFRRGDPGMLDVPAGRTTAVPVTVERSDATHEFWVQQAPPYRLLSYAGPGQSAELVFIERRAYWNPQKTSDFYVAGEAP